MHKIIFALPIVIALTLWSLESLADPVQLIYKGPRGVKILNQWNPGEWKKTNGSSSRSFSDLMQKWTKVLDSTELAEIDLFNLYSNEKLVARYPRYLVVRNWVRVQFVGSGLEFSVKPTVSILMPVSVLNVKNVTRIELTNTQTEYPGTKLFVKTNPAASRGEKLFIRNCMTCHGLSGFPQLKVSDLTKLDLNGIHLKHKNVWDRPIDEKDFRGLQAYQQEWRPTPAEMKESSPRK